MDKPILYGGKLSYFTGKARSFLNFKKIDFEERLATPEIYKTIIMPRVGYPMIPVMVFPDDTLIQDTTELIDFFETNIHTPSATPNGPKQRLVSSLLELYGDEWLVIPAMHYRWAHNRDFALAEFGKLALAEGTPEEQYKAGEKAAGMFEGAVPLLGASPAMADAIERSYVSLLHEMDAHFSTHNFILGGKPCAGDFGLIGPLYAHLYRDPASGALMKKEAPNVARWVERMIAEPFIAGDDYVEDDIIPPTLMPVLKRMMSEQGPCLLDLFEKLSVFKEQNPDKPIPRVIGMHPFTVSGETGQRIMLPYSQWMAQRAFEPLNALNETDQTATNALLTEIGAAGFIGLTFDTPVTREAYKLVWR